MRLKGTPATEFRFELIVKLHAENKKQSEIAKLLNCSQVWVSRILKRHAQNGSEAFKVKGKPKGKPKKMNMAQIENLKFMLLEGALAHNFATDNWTQERIKELINNQFSVSYSTAHISNIVKEMGFTLQKPVSKSYRQSEEAVAEWKEITLPSLKKKL